MRPLVFAAAVALFAAGCSNPCQDLGDKLCACSPTGTTTETCKRQVSNMAKSPTSGQQSACEEFYDNCNAPSGVDFCEWLATETGKEKCGLAY
jgi:hypothetical protein